jgi:short-subunit dehydrogenase involved in D-alanine esterification of teichoic acids
MRSLRSLRAAPRKVASAVLIAAGILGAGAIAATAVAAQDADQKATVQKEKKLAQGEKEAKKMLLLMDKDRNGKVSKQEFMNFMEAEFERLDINKDGELDVQELTGSRVQIRTRGR